MPFLYSNTFDPRFDRVISLASVSLSPLPPRSPSTTTNRMATMTTFLRSTPTLRRAFQSSLPAFSNHSIPMQPHPHGLPVNGFIGAIGNTPLVRNYLPYSLSFEKEMEKLMNG